MLKRTLAAAAIALIALPVWAIDKGRDRGEPEDSGDAYLETYDAMGFTLSDNSRFRAEQILLAAPNGIFSLSLEGRVKMRNEDRLPTTGVPWIGDLFMPQVREKDFDPANVVGSAHKDGNRLVVVLDGANLEIAGEGGFSAPTPDGGLYQPLTLIAANQKVSYHVQVAAARASAPEARDFYDLPQVGEVYWAEDALLVLVRPSIITHWE